GSRARRAAVSPARHHRQTLDCRSAAGIRAGVAARTPRSEAARPRWLPFVIAAVAVAVAVVTRRCAVSATAQDPYRPDREVRDGIDHEQNAETAPEPRPAAAESNACGEFGAADRDAEHRPLAQKAREARQRTI